MTRYLGAVRIAVALVVGGCWASPLAPISSVSPAGAPSEQPTQLATREPREPRRIAPARPIVAPLRVAGHGRVPFPAHSVWSGTYTCSQGLTGVTLSIDLDDTVATAVFEFTAVPSNPSVPSGSSRMTGTVTQNAAGTASVDLVPGAWISQPPGWFLVGVNATSDGALSELHGTINASTCGAIDLTRGP